MTIQRKCYLIIRSIRPKGKTDGVWFNLRQIVEVSQIANDSVLMSIESNLDFGSYEMFIKNIEVGIWLMKDAEYIGTFCK